MTSDEKARIREVYEHSQIGHELARKERRRRIRETSTADGIQSLRRAFELAAKLPPRPSSGLIEFYAKLKQVYEGRL